MSAPKLQGMIIPVTPLQQNCSVLWCTETRRAVVVDPGGDIEKIMAEVNKNNLILERVLLTHAHVDHAGAAAEIAEINNIQITGPHHDDQFWIDQIEDAGKQYGIPTARVFTPENWLEDGDCITVGRVKLDVYHCPGHTPGHVIFHNIDSSFAAVGDVLFQGSIGRSDFPRGDMQQLIQSIIHKLWPLGDQTTFIPGHGPLSTFGEERKTNPFVADHILSKTQDINFK